MDGGLNLAAIFSPLSLSLSLFLSVNCKPPKIPLFRVRCVMCRMIVDPAQIKNQNVVLSRECCNVSQVQQDLTVGVKCCNAVFPWLQRSFW